MDDATRRPSVPEREDFGGIRSRPLQLVRTSFPLHPSSMSLRPTAPFPLFAPCAHFANLAHFARFALFALFAGGCTLAGRGSSPSPPAGPVEAGWSEEGIASWYGEPFHGRTTASGERYDMDAPTAAHKSLPFGARVRVENLDNDRSTILTINDRGPFVRGRIIDVSRWGADELGMIGAGVARVRITVLEAPTECWEVQAGAFSVRENAEGLRTRLAEDGFPARVDGEGGGMHRVRVGPYTDRGEAERVAGRLGGARVAC